MNDMWTNRLSEYLDGELDATERSALEAHLATCGTCYATLAELQQVVARAKALPDTPPAKDLWTGIRAEITEKREVRVTRRFSFSVPQLLAASVVLALLSGGGVWMAVRPQATRSPDTAVLPSRENNAGVRQVAWTRNTDAAIADLQTALVENESKLDTATVRIVRQNLAIIDRAIADARVALEKDPGNAYLNLHLAETMRRKVELLRRVNAMAART